MKTNSMDLRERVLTLCESSHRTNKDYRGIGGSETVITGLAYSIDFEVRVDEFLCNDLDMDQSI